MLLVVIEGNAVCTAGTETEEEIHQRMEDARAELSRCDWRFTFQGTVLLHAVWPKLTPEILTEGFVVS